MVRFAFLNYRALFHVKLHSLHWMIPLPSTKQRTLRSVLQLIKKSQSIWALADAEGCLIIDLGTIKVLPIWPTEAARIWLRVKKITKDSKVVEISAVTGQEKMACQACKTTNSLCRCCLQTLPVSASFLLLKEHAGRPTKIVSFLCKIRTGRIMHFQLKNRPNTPSKRTHNFLCGAFTLLCRFSYLFAPLLLRK